MKKLKLFLLFLSIVTLGNSQETWKNSLNQDSEKPLTPYDTMIVPVKYRYIVASRMLYKDWCGVKKIENQQLYTIQSQNKQIENLLKSNNSLMSADSANKKIIQNNSMLLADCEMKFLDSQYNLKRNKAAKIGTSITIPFVAVASFLLGWYLHN